jgi:hypothetical protein
MRLHGNMRREPFLRSVRLWRLAKRFRGSFAYQE